MRKDFLCKGCVKGPCVMKEDEVRPVLVDYCKSYHPSSSWWKHYDFTRVHQCFDLINTRNDIFWCECCGFILEDHMLHTLEDAGENLRLCPDCYKSLSLDVRN